MKRKNGRKREITKERRKEGDVMQLGIKKIVKLLKKRSLRKGKFRSTYFNNL